MIEELYERYHLELVKWCTVMTGDFQTSEELVQEAFLRAMLHAEIFEGMEEAQRRSWLYRVTKNLYIDKKRHTYREIMLDRLPEEQQRPEKQQRPEEMEYVEWEEILNSLPDIEGVLFFMRYMGGYNSSQLSAIFSIPPGTIRSKLSSARKHLKEVIGGKGYVEKE